MKREYIRGNQEHWKEVCEYVYGFSPKTKSDSGICSDDNAIFVKNEPGRPDIYIGGIVYDAITTNPNWHEVKPWEDNWKPKPFDKVLGWNYNENAVYPDIFLYKAFDTYSCARGSFKHVKPYNDEEYLKSLEKSTDNE